MVEVIMAAVGTEWHTWIKGKFEEFVRERPEGEKGALMAFARKFRAPHQVVKGWLNDGAAPRKPEYITRLANEYGPEVYDILGVPPLRVAPYVDPTMPENETRAVEMLREVPEQNQEEILDLIELYLLRHGFRRVK